MGVRTAVLLFLAAGLAAGCAPGSHGTAPEAAPDAAVPTGAAISAEVGELPPSPATAEGLEAADGWKLAEWEDPGRLRRVEFRSVRKGSSAAVLHFATTGGLKGKSAAALTRDVALAPQGAVRLAAYNPGREPVRLAVAFWVSDNWVYYESEAQEVAPRAWQTLAFDLNAKTFKTASNNWQHSAGLWKREEAKQLAVLLFGGGRPAAIYLDGLTVDVVPAPAPAAAPKPPPAPRPRPAPAPAPAPAAPTTRKL